MRILIVSDLESKSLWDYYDETKLKGIDLILSCGDLSPRYLTFLVTFSSAASFMFRAIMIRDMNILPEGCICIEDMIYEYKGLRILGLGGSMRYKPGSPAAVYRTRDEKRIRKLMIPIIKKKGFDILLTHSPAYHLNDGDDLPHRGYECFLNLMDKYKPKYFIHGHIHFNYGKGKRCDKYGETIVINGYESYIIDVEPESWREKENGRKIWRFKRQAEGM